MSISILSVPSQSRRNSTCLHWTRPCTRLAADEPVKAELVTLRFFGGLSMPEAAACPGRVPGHRGTLLDFCQILVVCSPFRRSSGAPAREFTAAMRGQRSNCRIAFIEADAADHQLGIPTGWPKPPGATGYEPTATPRSHLLRPLQKGTPAERAAYLDEACAGDNESRVGAIEKMLTAQAQAGSFLEVPARELGKTLDQPLREKPGTQIGPYKLLQEIGQGGMGVVYMAEQQGAGQTSRGAEDHQARNGHASR